ncbi:MAG: MBL fold metallo-hydrolase, partial [Planctomycetota bacterium]
LVDFLFSAKYEVQPHPSLNEATLKYIDEGKKSARTKPLHLIGPAGFKNFYEGITKLYHESVINHSYPLIIDEVSLADLKFPNEHHSFWHLKSIDVLHEEHSVAYRLELPSGKSVVYSGDTNYCKNIVKIASEADLLILECSFPGNIYLPGHLNSVLAGRVAKEARVKKLVLTHLYPVCDDYDLLREVKSAWPEGDITIAEDLMQIKI